MLAFNQEFVKAQKIKTITFDIIDKRDFAVAEDKNLINYYEFNSNGQLVRFYYTNIIKTIEKEFHSQPDAGGAQQAACQRKGGDSRPRCSGGRAPAAADGKNR